MRKELYKKIVSLCLQDKVKAKYGKNYTQCTNAQLSELIDSATKPKETEKVTKVCKNNSDEKFNTLVTILKERHILLGSDVRKIMGA